jgi:transcriptional regulator with XRE-family HTH domain
MNFTDNIGAIVYKLRVERGLSQATLATRMGCPRTYISKVENGVCVPTFGMIQKIADALKVAPFVFIGEMSKYERDPFLLELAQYVPYLSAQQKEFVLDVVTGRTQGDGCSVVSIATEALGGAVQHRERAERPIPSHV